MVLLGLLRSSKLVLTYDALVRDHQPVEQAAEKTSTRAALRTCESHKRGVTFNGSAEYILTGREHPNGTFGNW